MSGERLYHDPDFKTALNNLGERVGGGKGPGLGLLNLMKTLSPCHRVPFGLAKLTLGFSLGTGPKHIPAVVLWRNLPASD